MKLIPTAAKILEKENKRSHKRNSNKKKKIITLTDPNTLNSFWGSNWGYSGPGITNKK